MSTLKEKFAMIFPGQGSQKLGMLEDYRTIALVKKTFDEASTVLGYDLQNLISRGPLEMLNQTEKTQPALLTCSVALWRLWLDDKGVCPKLMAGHSLGEYSALVCAGVLPFSAALDLVRKRGQYMQEAVALGAGKMAAVVGLNDQDVRYVCEEVVKNNSDDIVEAVNFNAPGQVVIAGLGESVLKAVELAKSRGAKRAIVLPVSVPAHCILMKSAATKLKEVLSEVPFTNPDIPVVQNVTAKTCADAQMIKENLVKQLYSPVLWADSIRSISDDGVQLFVECGPGKVLSGLTRRILSQATGVALENKSDMQNVLTRLGAETS